MFKYLFIIFLGISSCVNADVWFYEDQNGVMHFAQEKKGSKWRLLMRTPKSLDLPKAKSTQQKAPNQRPYHQLIVASARRHKLDPALVHAVIATESNYRADVVSRAGAMGLMQLMPATAERFSVTDPFMPEQNIEAGTRYLRWLLNEFESLQLALAAYNSGENTVKRYGFAIPPYKETQNYVTKVIERYKKNLSLVQ
ncbi:MULTISPECIES: lytic transglycosylase domain-containing protein [unclassified Agarivorans]|uniref:lytic transglycosylase domain-containing protein n=1 Tax=unclassified Agarivorans TaxID=2636026 RepID=UPI0026E12973|nr:MULTISPECIES: lytic transglycosylase domain-containing protein [unclassified Agarivorans]MDO6687807.1 lytic transglycosylase domain-containing protein [Agarivorans sp. 3_MG-2023]MDO6717329.1 lytic transglycosylase domain-containing protein [Agarivorans sp. 2_MG-2023]